MVDHAILALNAGSSSLKFSLRTVGDEIRLLSQGVIERINDAPHFSVRDTAGTVLDERHWESRPHFAELLGHVIDWCEDHLGDSRLIAVGHRVVHGGADHIGPEIVTEELLAALDKLTSLAPLHEPHNLAPIRAIAALRPRLTQVACFDTAFHHTMPDVAKRFAIPRHWEDEGIRRYGFHGLSYEWIARQLADIDPGLLQGRVIVAHLGNGASMCAMKDGRSIESTMGFTATDGLVMGTRCGEIDPGLVLHFITQLGMSAEDVGTMLNRESGLLGVSGISADMRELLASESLAARQAVELFVYRILRDVGALTAMLGGLDGMVFTGGIGEHAAPVRAMVAEGLGWLGAQLDVEANAASEPVISTPDSGIALRVIPTDEEAMITAHTYDLLEGPSR